MVARLLGGAEATTFLLNTNDNYSHLLCQIDYINYLII